MMWKLKRAGGLGLHDRQELDGAEEAGVEMLGPMAEVQVPNNPAIRADLTQPVPSELIEKLPINPQTNGSISQPSCMTNHPIVITAQPVKQLPHRTTEHTTYRGGQPVTRDVYTCPQCSGCTLAQMCRQNPESKRGREIMHDEHEPARTSPPRTYEDRRGQEKRYKIRAHKGETRSP